MYDIDATHDPKRNSWLDSANAAGASLHNAMVPHGPDEEAFDKASHAALAPQKLDNTLAFMFESRYRFIPTAYGLNTAPLDHDYADCWAGLKDQFKPA